jgi:MarR family transcriptional regulator, lower aerobic nicotinate degradation pathway regulator
MKKNARGAAKPLDPLQLMARYPGYLLRRVHQIADSYFVEETAAFGVTPVQYGALQVVRAKPGIDQLRLGNALRCDRTTVSGVVRRLEAKGLIRRTTDRADRRAKALFLTAKGARLLVRLATAVERAEARILSGLTEPERRRVFGLLDRAIRIYEAQPATN